MITHAQGIDLTQNTNQADFFNEVMLKVFSPKTSPKKVFNYGGAVRGGKTYISLFILMVLCKHFPGSRWHVIREDMPALKSTAIPSLEKLIAGSPKWKWSRDSSNYFAQYENGSKIFFKGENLSSDPELTDFLGLETNGFLLEQLEEVSEKMFNFAISRSGSWYLEKTPPGIILTTFNPTQAWPKDRIYMPWMKGELPEQYHFQPALPKDNPFVTDDQWEAWKMMDERYIRQFIDGDWTNFDSLDNRWAYAFSRKKHLGAPEYNPEEPIFLCWDFNRNPMCCSVIQWYSEMIKVLKTYKIKNAGSDIVCERIVADYPRALYIINGDYSGNTASTLFAEETSNYTIIVEKLGISWDQVQISPNPSLINNRTLVNSILQHMDVEMHEEAAASLIWDLENVKATPEGKLGKDSRTKREQQADSLDTFRYFCNQNLSWVLGG